MVFVYRYSFIQLFFISHFGFPSTERRRFNAHFYHLRFFFPLNYFICINFILFFRLICLEGGVLVSDDVLQEVFDQVFWVKLSGDLKCGKIHLKIMEWENDLKDFACRIVKKFLFETIVRRILMPSWSWKFGLHGI